MKLWISSSVVLKCKDALDKLSKKFQFRLNWVTGHSGIVDRKLAGETSKISVEQSTEWLGARNFCVTLNASGSYKPMEG